MFMLSKERRLLLKIDFSVLLLCTLMTWSNYINRANLSFGYVSGMKEELHFVGNDYTTMGAVFNIGYFFAMFAHSFAIQKFRPRYWLGSMAVLWGCFGIASFGVKTVGQLYACRVLISLAEACVFSGAQFILSHWYKNSELGLRGAIFASGANFGTLFSGVLQGAIYDSLNGHAGYSGWRWTFFVDGLIGIVIGLLLLAFFPDTPETTKSWIFTAEEKQLAITRLPSRNFEDVPVNWEGTRRILRGWRFWGFSLLFTLTSGLEAYGSYGIVPIWLKSLNKYSVSQYSYYALGLTAVTISTTIVSSACTDRWGYRHYATYVECILMIVSASMLVAWDMIPLGAKFFAFFLGGAGFMGQGSLITWSIETTRSRHERAFTIYGEAAMSQIILSFWGIAFFPVTSAPKYRRGFIATIPLAVVCAFVCAGIRYLDVRDIKQQIREGTATRGLNGLALQATDSEGDGESDIGTDKKSLHVVTDVFTVS